MLSFNNLLKLMEICVWEIKYTPKHRQRIKNRISKKQQQY